MGAALGLFGMVLGSVACEMFFRVIGLDPRAPNCPQGPLESSSLGSVGSGSEVDEQERWLAFFPLAFCESVLKDQWSLNDYREMYQYV
jgi:hypothetical protein